ncbi:uncharacterized protein KY384_000312 [Bacidia gigantensis]|uniref:uncharacterized protein n=1 Tax=Bacidia gigantensis TaxID=2732470 RepID=UPI001D04EDA2|nr:uncharacterized protein KY384_000312 [Bacidia gigantensis]KAG8526319.1 hypothetical protein KY384_000312 [Bacidia gigantensis]
MQQQSTHTTTSLGSDTSGYDESSNPLPALETTWTLVWLTCLWYLNHISTLAFESLVYPAMRLSQNVMVALATLASGESFEKAKSADLMKRAGSTNQLATFDENPTTNYPSWKYKGLNFTHLSLLQNFNEGYIFAPIIPQSKNYTMNGELGSDTFHEQPLFSIAGTKMKSFDLTYFYTACILFDYTDDSGYKPTSCKCTLTGTNAVGGAKQTKTFSYTAKPGASLAPMIKVQANMQGLKLANFTFVESNQQRLRNLQLSFDNIAYVTHQ